jgi:hypothetical protein
MRPAALAAADDRLLTLTRLEPIMAKNDDLNERITTAIEGQLLALLPPEDIRARVDMVIGNFFERQRHEYRTNEWVPSKFETIVSSLIAEHSQKIVREILSSPDWKVKVDNDLQRRSARAFRRFSASILPRSKR